MQRGLTRRGRDMVTHANRDPAVTSCFSRISHMADQQAVQFENVLAPKGLLARPLHRGALDALAQGGELFHRGAGAGWG